MGMTMTQKILARHAGLDSVRPGQLTRLQEGIRASLRRFFRRVLERDPVVVPIVSEV